MRSEAIQRRGLLGRRSALNHTTSTPTWFQTLMHCTSSVSELATYKGSGCRETHSREWCSEGASTP